MDQPFSSGNGRLDSWKAIAAYLNRDERTVRRWEHEQGLPVRRVPGGRGRSVFAYAHEIDAWLTAHRPSPAEQGSGSRPATAGRRWLVPSLAAALIVTVAGLLVSLRSGGPPASIELTDRGIVARDVNGVERWVYPFPASETFARPDARPVPVEMSAAHRGVLVATSHWVRMADETVRSGELLWLSLTGSLRTSFSFRDELRFGGTAYQAPWGITDFRVSEGAHPRIALAAHHFQWWPSMITVLDERWRRGGTFVNPGWLERVHWLSSERLLAAGYNEAIDGGAVALLDPNRMNGYVPLPGQTAFACDGCGADRPLKYLVMPRSEVNLASRSRFNRATLQLTGDAIVVRTIEMPVETGEGADALYEFDRDLNVTRASYSSRYWEMHARLERDGRLDHARDACPDRGGPRAMHVWEPSAGWRVQSLR